MTKAKAAQEEPQEVTMYPEPEELPEPPAAVEIPQALAGPDVLDAIFRRLPSGQDALRGGVATLIRSREVRFIFDGAYGAPGIFADEEGNYLDVEITLRSLSSTEELDALSEVTQATAMSAPMAMAKRSIYAIAGKKLHPDRRDFIWEALGGAGRQFCLMAFQQLGAASQVALGKYQSSFTVS